MTHIAPRAARPSSHVSAWRHRVLLGAALSALLPAAQARESWWSGGGFTDNWSNPFNWQEVAAPISDADATRVVFSAGQLRASPDLNADWQVNGVRFVDFTGELDLFSQSFTLKSSTGNTLVIGDGGILNGSEAVQTINHAIELGATQTWEARHQDLLVNGARSGAFDLRIKGGLPFRTVTLGGSGAFQSGNYFIESGTLRIGDVDAIRDASRVDVSAGAVFDLANTSERIGGLNAAGEVRIGTGHLEIVTGSNPLNLTGRLTGSGTLTIDSSATSFLPGNATGFSGQLVVKGGKLQVDGAVDSLSDQMSVVLQNAGALSVSGGVESFGSLAGAGTLSLNSNLTLGLNGRSTNFTGAINGTAQLIKDGAGTMTLTNSVIDLNSLAVTGGGLVLGPGTVVNQRPAMFVGNGARLVVDSEGVQFGSLVVGGEVDLKRALTVGSNTAPSIVSGRMFGNGSLTKTGSATLSLSGVNNARGALFIDDGMLEIAGNADTLGDAQVVDLRQAGARLRIAGNGEDFGGVTGSGTIELAADMGIGRNNANATFAGALTGTGKLSKHGVGSLQLTGHGQVAGTLDVRAGVVDVAAGSQAFTAATVQRDGRLRVTGGKLSATRIDTLGALALSAGTLEVGTLNVDAGGSFEFSGGTLAAGVVNGNLVSGGTLTPGAGIGRTTVHGDFTQTGSGRLAIDLDSATLFDQVTVKGGKATLGGTLDITLADGFEPVAGSQFDILTADGGIVGEFAVILFPRLGQNTMRLEVRANRLVLSVSGPFGQTPAPVPLPPAAWLFGSALLVVLGRRRR